MKYKIVYAGSMRDLEMQVNSHLQDGWILQGGVATSNAYTNSTYFYQAIAKE